MSSSGLLVGIGLLVLIGAGIALASRWSSSRSQLARHWKDTSGSGGTIVYQFADRFKRSGVFAWFESLGYDAVGLAALCLHETDYGRSYAAREYDNLFGVSYRDPDTGSMRPERYSSLIGCLERFEEVMRLSRYSGAVAARGDARRFLEELHRGGYNGATWLQGVLDAERIMRNAYGGR